jgi:CHASE3 domain sensor protein
MPVAGAALLFVLIVVVSGITIKELREAIYWREHTVQVLLEAQASEDNLVNAESHLARYVAGGTSSLLVEFRNETNSELEEFAGLQELTRDDPEQQQRLKDLNAAVKALFAYDDRVIGVYARQGQEAAQKLENSVEGRDALDAAAGDLETFKAAEKKLLVKRDAKEQEDFQRATCLLMGGSVVVAMLLILSNYVVGREMTRRRLAEARQGELIVQLQKALAEVNTLTGLIPICGWCKKVRADEGFWQSVEHYVSERTDAVFSHGMCPGCAKNWEIDLAKAAPSAAGKVRKSKQPDNQLCS